jgi:hypothetical protein
MRDVHDNDTIEELLVRSGDYLMERTAQYREQPVHTSTARQDAPRRYRRVLVGTAAAATLCVTALAGSFIGGASSGKVDVAEAAWSAIPATPTAEQVKKVQLDCGIDAEDFAKRETAALEEAMGDSIPPISPNSIPDYMLEPALIDVRGTTTVAAYFTWSLATLCVQFGDGSINMSHMAMSRHDEFSWQTPTAVEVEIEDIPATLIVGFLPPNVTGGDPNTTRESDSISDTQWEVYIEGPGIERTKASVSPATERFVAWVPATGTWKVTFVNTVTRDEQVVGSVVADGGKWMVSPNTTIVEASPND